MAFVGLSVTNTSRGPPPCAWISLTLEDQLANFTRTICKQNSFIGFYNAFLKSVERILKELRMDPWVDIESLHLDGDHEKLLSGMTPLHYAVLMGDGMMAHFILTSKKVDINAATTHYKETALHYAVLGGNQDIVEELLKDKADACILNSLGESTLDYMVLQGDSMFGILKRILVNNVNMCDEAKNTALHHATRFGATDVVTYLIGKVDVNLQNQLGYTPLHYATKTRSLDVVTCLLLQNANVNALNNNGWSPLHFAALEAAKDVVTLLIKWKANVEALTKYGDSPLIFAAEMGFFDIVTCLMEHNANINALDKDGRSPLLRSIKNHWDEIFNGLIRVGADVHMKDKWSNNALHLAIQAHGRDHNMADIVKLLRERNVDANAKNLKGYSPFFAVVVEGHTEVVKELLQSKEKIKLMEECNGQTAIEIAFDNGHEYIKRALLECDDVSQYVSDLYRDRQVYVDAANAILVGAALIASVTFASWLQPPLGYTTSTLDLAPSNLDMNYVDIQHNVSLRAFWIFNALSFYFAIGTVVFGARSIMPRRQMFIKSIVVQLYQNLLVTSMLLACSVFCVIIAFGIAGCIVLTPILQFQWYMIVPTIFGGLVCLVSLGFLFKSVVEDNLEKKKETLSLY